MGTISIRNGIPLNNILKVEIFDISRIDFMGTFSLSFWSTYIVVAIDYVSKWVEAVVINTNDSKVVVKFVKSHIFTKFKMPRDIISDGGSHIVNN